MYELRYVSPKTAARVWCLLFALLYIIISLLSLIKGFGGLSLVNSILVFFAGLVIAAVLGMLLGLIMAAAYNMIAKMHGGIHLDFRLIEDDEDKESAVHEDATVHVEPHEH